MSRTTKGSKGPGWEPWSNAYDRQQKAPDPDTEKSEVPKMFITPQEILKGRDSQYPLTPGSKKNLDILLTAVNRIRAYYGKSLVVSSGYRPGHFNTQAGGAARSSHLTCEAVDFRDADRAFSKWCLANLDKLEECGLYMENPEKTPQWVHLQTRATANRVFMP